MIPTNKLRWIVRQYLLYPPIPYSGTSVTPQYQGNSPQMVMVLQQWWQGVNNNGDVEGVWRDVPIEVEK